LATQPAWHDRYDRHAAGYARELEPTFAGSVRGVVELAEARRGIHLLDLATGTAAIARLAAARGASVVGVDASTGMLEVARTRSPGLDLRRADACALPFDDGAFDVVTCGLALSHFAERERALAEVLRVLRPSGLFVASAWAEGSSFPTTGVGEILDRYAGQAPTTVDEETWASCRRGRAVLREAGFVRISVRTETFAGEFADARRALDWFVAWPLTAARLTQLGSKARARFLDDARKLLATESLAWRFVFNLYVARSAPRPGA
jgi:SAM-dependent methyltransferase